MNNNFLSAVFILVFFVTINVSAQLQHAPSRVDKAAFFDKTPPLRDMPVIAPGQIDNSWKDGIIENETVNMNFGNNDNVMTDPKSVQDYMGGNQSRGPVVNAEGTGNVNGVYPPDTDGDVGPDHYFQMINLSFAIYDKNGTKLYGPVANSTLWNGFPGPWAGSNDGDPIVLYDELADRWVASQFAVYTSNNKYYELIAVSETGDPLGSWYRYAFEFDDFPDYPKLGVWHDGYYATFHMFSGNFQGMAAVAFEREKMLNGDPDAQMIYFGEYATRFGYLPSDIDGDAPPSNTPCYFAGINFGGNQNMEIWEMVPDWNNPSNSTFMLEHILDTDAFNSNINGIPQPGTGQKLDDFSSVLNFRLPFRTFGSYDVMLANHPVRVGTKSGIRWYELRNDGSGWYFYQQGTYAPDEHYRWLGSIAMSANGNIGLGYSVSSSTVYPSIRYTGRTPDAPLGEMNIEEVEVKTGGSSQTGINRWGDYACMSVDPTNDSVFWFTTEYMKSSGWGTFITSFDLSPVQEPTANAGEDVTLCEDQLFEATATATSQSSVLWETSGDGIFQNPALLNTKYLRGNGDLENGSVTLTLTVYGYQPGWEDSDELVITFVLEPEADAGIDFVSLPGDDIQLDGVASNFSSVEWETDGDGTFSDASLLNALYTPGSGDLTNGSVTLTLNAFSIEPCDAEDSDNVTITFGTMTGIDKNKVKEKTVKVIPNPNQGIFRIEFMIEETQTVLIKIKNLTGSDVYSDSFTATGLVQQVIDLSTWPQGTYLLEVQTGHEILKEKILLK
ncbi:MAG: T9SS type A sorting domain-containing protein [Bacteroidetes bacterium]|nr:T9SS type A sorting domain-containing protein [Bacteroidota bacterium]